MNSLCRTCLRKPDILLPLFQEDSKLALKIKIIAAVEVSADDGLPKNVCPECVVNINLSYNFRRIIISNDEMLHKHALQQQEPEKNNSNDEETQSSQCCSKVEILKHKEEIKVDNIKFMNSQTTQKQEECETDNEQSLGIEYSQDSFSEHESDGDDVINENETQDNRKVPQQPKLIVPKQTLYKCDKCDYVSTSRHKYRNHLVNHEIQICSICGKFITASNMSKHVAVHSAPPAQCEHCGRICKNFESLRGHVLIHKGVNRTCKKCGKFFKERKDYFAHLRSHKSYEDRTIECSICKKRVVKVCLKKHLRSHTGERPYPCEFCHKGFSSGNALKTHRRRHTNERPFKCPLCPMAFPQRVSLRTHLKSKHQKEDGIS